MRKRSSGLTECPMRIPFEQVYASVVIVYLDALMQPPNFTRFTYLLFQCRPSAPPPLLSQQPLQLGMLQGWGSRSQ